MTTRMFKTINTILTYPLIFFIRLYQLTFSPDKSIFFSWRLKWVICHHEPHCSQYCLEVLKKYGLFPGIVYMTDRVTSCTWASTISHDPSSYRVVFCSSAPIGAPFLEQLESDPRYDVIWVVTNPDRAVGRGMKMRKNIIKETAEKIVRTREDWKESFISTPPSLRLNSKKYATEAQEFQSWLEQKKPDLLVVIAYGKIIPQHILNIPTVAPINVHGSLLPAYRGASPIQSAFLDGQTESWITIMRMEAGLDTWPMIDKKTIPLEFSDTALNLIKKIQIVGPKFLNDTMREYAKWHIDETIQDDSLATHTSKLEKTDWLIDPYTLSLEEIQKTYKGCYLRPKTYFILDDTRWSHSWKQVTIDTLQIDEKTYNNHKTKSLIKKDNAINSAIMQLKVKPAWSKAMSRNDFLLGYQSK
jgi:methionyl-tRNA formyltransferase